MQDSNGDLDKRETDEPEADAEGHSMFLYESARNISRQLERDAQQAARQARLLKERKEEKRR